MEKKRSTEVASLCGGRRVGGRRIAGQTANADNDGLSFLRSPWSIESEINAGGTARDNFCAPKPQAFLFLARSILCCRRHSPFLTLALLEVDPSTLLVLSPLSETLRRHTDLIDLSVNLDSSEDGHKHHFCRSTES